MQRFSLSDRVLDNNVDGRDFVKRGKPKWLRARMPHGEGYTNLLDLVHTHKLHTVCEEASCPNMGECWHHGVATLMILGDVCTRSCGFCNVKTGKPPVLDTDEPNRVAEAIKIMDLRYVVITSVNRDELPDGGASIWAQTIRRTRQLCPDTQIEVLIPDFCGDWTALDVVLEAAPDVLGHNLETVKRLYPAVRPQAKYTRSLELLKRVKQRGMVAKTGIMVGIGETDEEVTQLMENVQAATREGEAACDILTIGQYLQPSANHLPVARWVTPEQFDNYKRIGEAMGFRHVESSPMVRSSYHADQAAGAAGVTR